MQIGKRYYEHIPMKDKVRRAKGSPMQWKHLESEGRISFRKNLKGKYVIKGNKEIYANATVSGRLQKNIDLLLFDEKGKGIALFYAKPYGGILNSLFFTGRWDIYHRYVYPNYRGLNLGIVSFRLMEFAIKKFGGREIIVNTAEKSVLNSLLGLGWHIDKHYETNLKIALGLKETDELPKLQEMRRILRENKRERLPATIRLRRSLVGIYEKTTKP